MYKNIKELLNLVEDLGWSINGNSRSGFELGKCSSKGQDFYIIIHGENASEIIEGIYNFYEGYDVSYEAYLWLDDTGHGKNGAPYEMIDVYNDMKECKEMVLELYNDIK